MTGVVGVLIANGHRTTWSCQQCKAGGRVDLQAIAREKGLDFDLTDRLPQCRTPGCGYWVGFYAHDGMSLRGLRTEEGMWRESEDRTRWLAERRARDSTVRPQRERLRE